MCLRSDPLFSKCAPFSCFVIIVFVYVAIEKQNTDICSIDFLTPWISSSPRQRRIDSLLAAAAAAAAGLE